MEVRPGYVCPKGYSCPPGYKQTEVGVIPEDWDVQSLEGIADPKQPICYGIVQVGPFTRNGIPVLAIKNLNTDYFTNVHRSSPEIETPYARSRVRPGDVLISVKGTTGRVGIVPQHFDGNISRDLARLRLIEKDVPEFWLQMLQSETAQRKLDVAAVGTTRMELSIGTLKQVRMPCPPKEEQRAIAGALSDVDALIGALDQIIAKKRDLKQAAMQQLLTGQKRLPGFHGEWEVKRLGDVADVDPDNLPSSTAPDYEFNYISLEDVDAGVLRSSSEQVFRSAPSRARRKLREGDILVSTVRPNLKSHLLFTIDAPHWVCSTGFAVVRCRESLTHPGYVFFNLFGCSVSQQIDAFLTGSNYPAINSGDVRALRIPLPKFPEQIAIAEVLSGMDAEVAALTQRRDKTRALKQGMMQELLTGRTRLA
jgi:type I restriction enzyme S subunit